jgi:1-pyrroline-5-carboxylate dehydrogenase
MDALFRVPAPANEPVLGYAPGSSERATLEGELARIGGEQIDLPSTIGGRKVMGGGRTGKVVQPHAHRKVLGTMKLVTPTEAQSAIDAAKAAAPMWRDMPFADRAAILLKAAELLSGPWRATLNAATMLGQSKTAPQAEIDSACELIDFWRINVHFAQQILPSSRRSTPGVWNRATTDRSKASSTPSRRSTSPRSAATCRPRRHSWETPSSGSRPRTQQLALRHYTMLILEAAGLPPGVINLVTGRRRDDPTQGPADRDFAGMHFTGSTGVFHSMWEHGRRQHRPLRTYPRLVGETGGKDFVVAHPSADIDVRCAPRSCAAPSSSRGRSARPPRAPMCRRPFGSA